ncbi:conserved oligomeric Golgi complex subunit 8 [Patella vulgata]|uniref:conserved oligomeric Golgi complex subunit 8 n=1 Tax=Patella vulgata TaxID=6465 RepID=UPI00217FDCD5|nr:conserved oligomeric Golgi complex subunit 8 [Patella vulgata]
MSTIDVEDENILTSIFKDAFSENWQENPDFVKYLVELSSFGVDTLAREPDRLAEERAQILEETRNLAFHNYTTFIQTADCSKEIFEDFQIIEGHLDSLLTKLPNFSQECDKVIKKTQEISSSRRMNTLTLQRHTQLLEILEMPQLMDTCVRNGYYEEALELTAHVKRLEKKHANIPVIMNIVNEVRNSTQLMLNQLIQQLRTNIQLPACLRVIGYLRRMDVFTEAELRIKFLQARDSWLQNILEAIPKDDPYNHITKTIEASRVHLFDVITQYRAIFSDDDPLLTTRQDTTVNETALFHGWVVQKVSQFLSTLENDLQRGIGGRLDSLLGQCMYFGLSFSRVGADFRGLLAPIFQNAALSYFQAALQDANKKFEENMQSYNLLGISSTGSNIAYGTQTGQLYPPTVLLDFYPLAAYCNHILIAFNELRLCAPINLACNVAESLQRSLLQINRVVLAFNRAEETTFNIEEKEQFGQFCATYVVDLLPYINKCLQALFPTSQLSQVLGLPISDLIKEGKICQVEITPIVKQVQHLMPVKQEIKQPTPQLSPETNKTPIQIETNTSLTTTVAGSTSSDMATEPGKVEPEVQSNKSSNQSPNTNPDVNQFDTQKLIADEVKIVTSAESFETVQSPQSDLFTSDVPTTTGSNSVSLPVVTETSPSLSSTVSAPLNIDLNVASNLASNVLHDLQSTVPSSLDIDLNMASNLVGNVVQDLPTISKDIQQNVEETVKKQD